MGVGTSQSLNNFGKAAAQSVVGGVAQVARGGKFLAGFLSTGVASAANASRFISNIPSEAGRFITSSVIGGVSAELGGGKFKNGALTSAFAYAVGSVGQNLSTNSNSSIDYDAFAQAEAAGVFSVGENGSIIAALGDYIPGTQAGVSSTQYWADLATSSNNPLVVYPANFAGGLSSLWTPSTAVSMVSILFGGYVGRVLGPFPIRTLPKFIQRPRQFLRFDAPHHGKGFQFDGTIPKKLKGFFERGK